MRGTEGKEDWIVAPWNHGWIAKQQTSENIHKSSTRTVVFRCTKPQVEVLSYLRRWDSWTRSLKPFFLGPLDSEMNRGGAFFKPRPRKTVIYPRKLTLKPDQENVNLYDGRKHNSTYGFYCTIVLLGANVHFSILGSIAYANLTTILNTSASLINFIENVGRLRLKNIINSRYKCYVLRFGQRDTQLNFIFFPPRVPFP